MTKQQKTALNMAKFI
ncbi:Rop family plasmid primer RNA-binding protein, partial [Klebsiella pneumoniae]